MSLAGFQVVSFESRRAELVVELVRAQGGACFNAPSVRELPLEENEPCLQLVRDLVADRYEALVLLSGVGAEYLREAAKTLDLDRELVGALARVKTIARGPKPAAVLRKWGVPADLNVGEPNTWREVADAMTGLDARKVAVQEYGVSNPEFTAVLQAKGFDVTATPVYRWALPLDTQQLEEAGRRIVAGACDVAIFLSSVQLVHLLEVSDKWGLRDLILRGLSNDVVVCSIGPVMNDALAQHGLAPDFVPRHPKLAICIRQLAGNAQELISRKRRHA